MARCSVLRRAVPAQLLVCVHGHAQAWHGKSTRYGGGTTSPSLLQHVGTPITLPSAQARIADTEAEVGTPLLGQLSAGEQAEVGQLQPQVTKLQVSEAEGRGGLCVMGLYSVANCLQLAVPWAQGGYAVLQGACEVAKGHPCTPGAWSWLSPFSCLLVSLPQPSGGAGGRQGAAAGCGGPGAGAAVRDCPPVVL